MLYRSARARPQRPEEQQRRSPRSDRSVEKIQASCTCRSCSASQCGADPCRDGFDDSILAAVVEMIAIRNDLRGALRGRCTLKFLGGITLRILLVASDTEYGT